MNKDSIANTFFVAVALCLVCSAFVALAAIGLKPIQDKNKSLDRKKNVLIAAGLAKKSDSIDVEKVFSAMILDRVIDLKTGEDVTSEYGGDASKYDAEAALLDDALNTKLPTSTDVAVLKKRENRAHVYLVKTSESNETPVKYVFPIRGKGLWSTIKGFLAVNADLKTAAAVTFYEDGETPGLGGEINSEDFQQQWPGKIVLADDGSVVLKISKAASGNQEISSLSGATITSIGVQNMVYYWLGPDGFGKYLQNLRGAPSGS